MLIFYYLYIVIIPIEINSQDLLGQFQMSKSECEDVIDYAVKGIVAKFAELWESEAGNNLKATRQRYVESLSVIDSGRMSGAVILSYKDPLVKMIEEGISAYDMKESFEHSDKVKHNKEGGWYLTIPLAAGAPETQGDSLGISNTLPPEVHAVVRAKPVSPTTGRSQGLTAGEIPEQYKAPQTRAKIEIPKSKVFEAYQHKSSIYEGVFKEKDKTTGQNSYSSFRRVGENSDANSWIHPGMEARNFAEKALDRLDTVMEQELTKSMDAALSQFGFE